MGALCDGFLAVRARQVASELRKLDLDSANGPDAISSRFLKACCLEIVIPLSKLARRILELRRWPEAWVVHRVVAIHKRNAVFKLANYRGVHLTSQIAKVNERVLSPFFVPKLERQAFSVHQFAYRKAHGSRDAIAFYVLSWLLSLKPFHASRSSANVVFVKPSLLSGRRESAKKVFHRDGPRIVPWNTLSAKTSSGEAAPPSTT